ncbi:MAG TPA: group III truncated hemoglobin [Saprospiraceae bacterium]|nr:group III truncated hemoglobin [Saprospiraceae bacterium]
MNSDIKNRADIDLLIRTFYNKLLADEKISYLFTEVAKIDLVPHLDIISSFWEGILFQTGNYHRNAMAPHLVLHRKSPLTRAHFKIWLHHLYDALDELFAGKNADIVKMRAKAIAEIMQMKTEMMSGFESH